MRLSDFCNRITSRAPCTLPDSRSCLRRSPFLACALPGIRHLQISGEASLDGEPPASALPQPAHRSLRLSPSLPAASNTARSWWSIDRSLLRAVFPVGDLFDRVRACSSASDVLCRPRRFPRPPVPFGPFRRSPRRRPGSLLDHDFVKSHGSARTRTPSLDECSLLRVRVSPRIGLRFTRLTLVRIHREPATVPAAADRLRTPFRPLSSGSVSIAANLTGDHRLDPPRLERAWRWTRRLSSTSAIRTAHEHNHEPSEPRHGCAMSLTQLALGWRRPPGGVGAPSASSITDSRAFAPELRGSTLRGASLLGYRAAPVVHLSPDLAARVRTLRPVQDSRSTPAEVSRARGRMAKPARPLPCLRPKAPHACRSWPTRAHGSLSPSRSTRAPPVTGPRRYRLEIRHRWSARPKPDRPPRRSRHASTLFGSPCGGAPCGASGREPLRVPRTARFRAPPAASHPLSRMVPTNQASCAALIAQRRLSHPARLGSDLLAQTAFPGPRVASPDDPRRTSRSAAPEVHSVAELPPFTTLDLRPEPLLGQDVIHSL